MPNRIGPTPLFGSMTKCVMTAAHAYTNEHAPSAYMQNATERVRISDRLPTGVTHRADSTSRGCRGRDLQKQDRIMNAA